MTTQKTINNLYHEFNTYDVKRILKMKNIPVLYYPLGDVTLGYTATIKRIKTITVDNSLNEIQKDFILGHELSHVLNNDIGTPYYRRVGSFSAISKKEKQANNLSLGLLACRYELDKYSRDMQIKQLGLSDFLD